MSDLSPHHKGSVVSQYLFQLQLIFVHISTWFYPICWYPICCIHVFPIGGLMLASSFFNHMSGDDQHLKSLVFSLVPSVNLTWKISKLFLWIHHHPIARLGASTSSVSHYRYDWRWTGDTNGTRHQLGNAEKKHMVISGWPTTLSGNAMTAGISTIYYLVGGLEHEFILSIYWEE